VIAQNKDATASQVGYKYATRVQRQSDPSSAQSINSMKSKELGLNKRNRSDNQKCTKRETCFNCGAKPAHPRSERPAKKVNCFKCGKDGHYGSVCKSKSTRGSFNELQTQPIDAPLNEDSTAEDYTPVYFTATMHHLKMVIVRTLDHPQPQPHIHPLWLSKELSSQISRSPVKSIQLQAATFYLCSKQQLLLERISSWDNRQ